MRRIAAPLIAGLAVLGVTACSPDEGSFKDSAQGFIEDEDGDVAQQTGLTFTDANCEEPASTDEGETFTCTATGSDGQSYEFTAEITGDREFTIQNFQPTGAATGGSTPGSAPSSAPAGTPGSTPATTPTS